MSGKLLYTSFVPRNWTNISASVRDALWSVEQSWSSSIYISRVMCSFCSAFPCGMSWFHSVTLGHTISEGQIHTSLGQTYIKQKDIYELVRQFPLISKYINFFRWNSIFCTVLNSIPKRFFFQLKEYVVKVQSTDNYMIQFLYIL